MPEDNLTPEERPPSPRGEKLMAQYWGLYLKLGKISESVMPPEQLLEVKLAFYTGMRMMLDCIGRGELVVGLEKMEADKGDYYSAIMQALFEEMNEFINNELPILTLKAEIHLNSKL